MSAGTETLHRGAALVRLPHGGSNMKQCLVLGALLLGGASFAAAAEIHGTVSEGGKPPIRRRAAGSYGTIWMRPSMPSCCCALPHEVLRQEKFTSGIPPAGIVMVIGGVRIWPIGIEMGLRTPISGCALSW
jgi:hypothetical protein